MSVVTNVMLQFDGVDGDTGFDPDEDPNDHENMLRIQTIVRKLTEGQSFKSISNSTSSWGGNKVPECQLFAAAFNHLPLGEFISELNKLTWLRPEMFCLFIQEQDDETFGVWLIQDKKVIQVVKPYRI